MKITKEVKTAILVISSIVLFIWGYSYLKGKDLLTHYRTFFVEYASVEGLTGSSAVTINGLVVGKVVQIKLQPSGKLLVELQVKNDFPISKSSKFNIYEPGLIASKQIEIIPNLMDQSEATSGMLFKGGVHQGLTDLVGEKLAPIQEKLGNVLTNADKLLIGVNNVLDADGQANLKKTLAELSQTIAQFHKASENINVILEDNKSKIGGMVTNFNKVSSDFSKISDSLNKADLGKTVKNLQVTIDKVDKLMTGIEAGKGTVGKLMKDETLYINLSKTSKELELLMQDLRLNPTRYINVSLFGKKNKTYSPPVSDTLKKDKK